ncbi:glycoside hydrolase family 27 protein [Kallotenue papyrolyticum]|uniref:glycoside hydrolase family 27 protein n=1 Tax=Kallotenue papyrolyticum TaxID=1325125 RepID=UPI0004785F61|nr:glycoside hydrolase family 27 protein [Kallotenue papyrolyticum]
MTATTSLAATPPMGWNSWNMFGSAVSETVISEMAEAIVAHGLRELGYQYVVIDDCWTRREGRDSNGDLVPDPERFPSGIKALADYVHSLGLKLGIYSDAAELTCAGYPGSYGFEEQDAQLWAAWGIDFLKYDYCHAPVDQASAIERYRRMGEALRATGRPILFSLCEWGGRSPHLWGRSVGGHMWRVSGDVFDSWVNIWIPHGAGYYGVGIDTALDIAAEVADYGGPGGWNDLDMLVVGLRGKGQIAGHGMSFLEYQTHMSIWCLACSPLMIGCDVRRMDRETAALLTNQEVLAINQDALGVPARRVKQIGRCDLWRKPLADGSQAVAVTNRGSTGQELMLRAGEIGLLDTPKLARDLWRQEDIAEFRETLALRVEPHQTILLRIRA